MKPRCGPSSSSSSSSSSYLLLQLLEPPPLSLLYLGGVQQGRHGPQMTGRRETAASTHEASPPYLALAGYPLVVSTLAPPTLAPPTLAPPTLAPPTLAPPTLSASQTSDRLEVGSQPPRSAPVDRAGPRGLSMESKDTHTLLDLGSTGLYWSLLDLGSTGPGLYWSLLVSTVPGSAGLCWSLLYLALLVSTAPPASVSSELLSSRRSAPPPPASPPARVHNRETEPRTQISPVAPCWALTAAAGLDRVEDLLELLIGQTRRALLRSRVPIGRRARESLLPGGSRPAAARPSCFPAGPRGADR
ncbi:hypothetical protein EYF80_045096 [Liparis tanakae]|uniref:Uncharacterized protein n=1 Tax=Liparis tanakae TaxID=230148 RepID=A0A4Z2FVV4_9TELE|nr:hypothetical protein EYF80_045096 [Liparis tanakae]